MFINVYYLKLINIDCLLLASEKFKILLTLTSPKSLCHVFLSIKCTFVKSLISLSFNSDTGEFLGRDSNVGK